MGKVLWLFGLSAAGKTTIASELSRRLPGTTILLDGDEIRARFPLRGFSRSERNAHLLSVAEMAAQEAEKFDFVICSLITPYEETRSIIKGKYPHFQWIWVDAPLSLCEKRDPKGLYKKARAGEVPYFTGISDPFENPSRDILRIRTDHLTVNGAVSLIEDHLNSSPQLFSGERVPFKIKDFSLLEKLENDLAEILNKLSPSRPGVSPKLVINLRRMWKGHDEDEEVRQRDLNDFYNFLNTSRPLALQDAEKIHEALIKKKGKSFRQIPLYARDLEGNITEVFPDPVKLSKLWNDFCLWREHSQLTIVNVFIQHLIFLSIHPFEDGNGRVARSLDFLELSQLHFPFQDKWHPELIIHWGHDDYVKALTHSRNENCADPFVETMLKLYIDTALGLL